MKQEKIPEATITCEKCKEEIKTKEAKTRVPQSTTENGKTITKDIYYHTECYPGRSISIDGIPNPRLIKKPFIKTQNLIQKITKKEGKITEELEEPLLLLIKENGYIEPIQGVKAGEFTIEQETSQGKPTLKTIYLTPEKIRKLKYGEGSTYYCWVAYENDFDPYPFDPVHGSEMFYKIVQKIAMNYRERDEQNDMAGKGKMWFMIIGGIALLIVIVFSIPSLREAILHGGATALQNATTNMTNTTMGPSIIKIN